MKKSLVMLAALAAIGESAAAGWSRRGVDKEAFGHERHDLGTHMLVDANLQLSAAQAVTASAVSTNTVDLSVARDLGPGRSLFVVWGVDTTATAAGAATVTFQVITSAAAALTSPSVVAQTDAIGKAELTAGRKLIAQRIDPSVLVANPNGQRYLGAQYTVATGPLTAGAFTCYVTDSLPPGAQLYASGFTVA